MPRKYSWSIRKHRAVNSRLTPVQTSWPMRRSVCSPSGSLFPGKWPMSGQGRPISTCRLCQKTSVDPYSEVHHTPNLTWHGMISLGNTNTPTLNNSESHATGQAEWSTLGPFFEVVAKFRLFGVNEEGLEWTQGCCGDLGGRLAWPWPGQGWLWLARHGLQMSHLWQEPWEHTSTSFVQFI